MCEKRMVYITKYALTDGVYYTEADICSKNMVCVHPDSSDARMAFTQYFHGKDFHFTREEAIARVKDMKERRLRSLEKSKNKIEKIDPGRVVDKADGGVK